MPRTESPGNRFGIANDTMLSPCSRFRSVPAIPKHPIVGPNPNPASLVLTNAPHRITRQPIRHRKRHHALPLQPVPICTSYTKASHCWTQSKPGLPCPDKCPAPNHPATDSASQTTPCSPLAAGSDLYQLYQSIPLLDPIQTRPPLS